MKINANNFSELNIPLIIDRSNKIIESLTRVCDIYPEDAKQICQSQIFKSLEDGDVWRASAYMLAYNELFEQVIRQEDKTCAPNEFKNGGFDETPVLNEIVAASMY